MCGDRRESRLTLSTGSHDAQALSQWFPRSSDGVSLMMLQPRSKEIWPARNGRIGCGMKAESVSAILKQVSLNGWKPQGVFRDEQPDAREGGSGRSGVTERPVVC